MSLESVSRALAHSVSLLQRPPAPLLALAIALHKLVGLEGVERRDTEEIARIAKSLYSTADWTILFGALTQGGTLDCITPKALQDRLPCHNYERKQDALYFTAKAVVTLGKEGYIRAAKDMEQVGVAVFRWRNLQEAMELLEDPGQSAILPRTPEGEKRIDENGSGRATERRRLSPPIAHVTPLTPFTTSED